MKSNCDRATWDRIYTDPGTYKADKVAGFLLSDATRGRVRSYAERRGWTQSAAVEYIINTYLDSIKEEAPKMDRMGLYEGMTEVTESTQTRQDDSGEYFRAATEADALREWETSNAEELRACRAEKIADHIYKLHGGESETVNRLYVRAAEYTFEFSKWTDGSGYDYTETIANGPTWGQGDAAALGNEYCTNPGDRIEILTPAGEVIEKYIKK